VQPLAIRAHLQKTVGDREHHAHLETSSLAQEIVQPAVDDPHGVLERAISPGEVRLQFGLQPGKVGPENTLVHRVGHHHIVRHLLSSVSL
jgi:hypothetical protein